MSEGAGTTARRAETARRKKEREHFIAALVEGLFEGCLPLRLVRAVEEDAALIIETWPARRRYRIKIEEVRE